MKFSSPYWNNRTKIQLLQRWILVHSFIYYELNKNIVSDQMFDSNSKQLVELQEADTKAFKQSRYYYAMKSFDGSSGFGFTDKLNEYDFECVTRDAYRLVQGNIRGRR
jgi:hypothetical protein